MRILLLVAALCCFFAAEGQVTELSGKYGAFFVGGETIDFVGRDSVYLDGSYCTFGVYGKGRCEVRGNYLYLYFGKTKSTAIVADTLKPPLISATAMNDSICKIQITCLANNGDPIPYATVLAEHGTQKIKVAADAQGNAIVTVAAIDWPLTIQTSAVDIEPLSTTLREPSDYSVKLFHRYRAFPMRELNSGEVRVYEIEDLSEDLIRMRPLNSAENFREYRKMKK